ncbi:hypothetical protein TSUD_50100 [Trifolium subterraneum]|uniref:Protein kinase domain-containing protein n=1 Tax=Trifolium subterraneum TaxID=3900 RepID=A0A2Z6LLV6_TRISU|nr:hypothetical protein TSUD_50100 [Trifolium subterraneum]
MAPVDLFCFLLFCHLALILSAGYGSGYQYNCSRSFSCGVRGTLRYPFTKAEQPDCGFILIHGCDASYYSPKFIQLEKNAKTVELTSVINDQHTITISDQDFYKRYPLHATAEINPLEMAIKIVLSADCDECCNLRGGQCRLDANKLFYCHNDRKELSQMPNWICMSSELGGKICYSDVKKITNSFKNKLGQGGYASVYKGKLHDERMVAVKALIYEFMPNGSLEKFIYEEKDPLKNDRQLDCKTLYDIAVGIARGLGYLHRGCNTRILHFDIKPHNILLDDDFCPKISDFGHAKICPKKESIVSLFGARGTPGYIAPELFSRNFGGVSHKSDVYSYGMMVLEMVGQKKNIKVEVDCSSELYFPHWIYKRLELNQDLGLRCIKNEIDEVLVRKMTMVSLWCIQTDPTHRPAMHKVVEMLEGSLQVLEIPPKPFL